MSTPPWASWARSDREQPSYAFFLVRGSHGRIRYVRRSAAERPSSRSSEWSVARGRRPPKRPRRSSTMGNARMRDHSGAHGVELDVRAASEKISLAVDRCRPVASLPQRADSTVGGIDVSDVAPAEGLDRAWQAVFVARCRQQMRVVGDQHIGMDRAIIGRCGLREPGAGMMV